MAIDPRISLGLQMPTIQSASAVNNIFQNNLNQAQSRAIGEQQKQINEQTIQSGKQSAQENQENRVIQLANEIAPTITSLIQNGKTDEAALTFLNHIADLQSKGLDPGGAQQMLEKLRDGESEVVLDALGRINQTARDRGLLASTQASAGQREFQNLLNIAQSDTATDIEKKAAKTALGILARAGTITGEERAATDPTLGALVAEQAGAESEAKEGGKLAPELKRQTQTQNLKRISELTQSEKSRRASINKAKRFLKAFKGSAKSGASRTALSFLPGVFTDQAQFDEQFNAFSEVAARQQLKAAGEIRPTDADVEGMKRAMFGVGRDEETNINLLQEFINDQDDLDVELDELRDAKRVGKLNVFTGLASDLQSLSDEELAAKIKQLQGGN